MVFDSVDSGFVVKQNIMAAGSCGRGNCSGGREAK